MMQKSIKKDDEIKSVVSKVIQDYPLVDGLIEYSCHNRYVLI